MDEKVYSFFRNLRSFFGIPHRLEPVDQNPRKKALRLPSPDLYDDTDYASSNSFVQEYEPEAENNGTNKSNNNNSNNNNNNNNNRNYDEHEVFTYPRGRSRFDDGFPGSIFPFGNKSNDPFGLGPLFKKLEKEFPEMGELIDRFGFNDGYDDRFKEFGLFNEPIIDRDRDTENEEAWHGRDCIIDKSSAPNVRDEVLKPGNHDGKPEDNGGLRSTPPESFPIIPKSPRSGSHFNWNWSSSSSTSTVFNSNGDGTTSHAYSRTIRDTPEGREITTYRQNKDGTAERSTEFIPRKDLPADSSQPGQIQPFDFMRGFFRPRS